ncbi:hypothetical protein C8J56DRAFT_342466 [Mycena floridula]|nr:hypothetical protein C8J56DRAFT_342466 [Mycena floridula]
MHEYEYPFSVTGAVLGYDDDGDEGYGDKESTGGFTYDITDIFVKGSGALAPNSVLFAEGYTLTDAMCVFEIGEPRLDTGMRPISQSIASTIDSAPSARSFASSNIHTPLLPEEICWILDRVWGLETEDFHADMNKVSLVREMSVRHVLGGLEALKGWIWASRDTRSTSDPGQERDEDVYWREALVARIRLREVSLSFIRVFGVVVLIFRYRLPLHPLSNPTKTLQTWLQVLATQIPPSHSATYGLR